MPKQVLTETRLYPVVFHREGDVWGYFSPEFGGGGAATQSDAMALAQDMLSSEIADLCEQGEEVPEPTNFLELDPCGGRVVMLPVTISNAAERVSVTLPKTLVAKIDATTDNRSAFIAELARERLSGSA